VSNIKRTLFAACLLLAVAAALLISGTPAEAEARQVALRGDVERGSVLFVEYSCYACHGYTGETGSGTRLNPPRLNQSGFIAYLRNPPRPAQMPPYKQTEATDQNLADIFAFISSLESNSPDVDEIPLLGTIIDEVN